MQGGLSRYSYRSFLYRKGGYQVKEIEFQQIADCKFDSEKKQIHIIMKSNLKDAFIKLSHFSHCVLFTKENHGIHCYTTKIAEICEEKGELLAEFDEDTFVGDLVDIKPYFPCEEIADGYNKDIIIQEKKFEPLSYKGKPIGSFFNVHDGGKIQFQESADTTTDEIVESIKYIKADSFLRILWWFDRFDDKRYRSHLMCSPPYENAPKCGVFATRSPVRPNPLASTIVKVKSADPYNKNISILGFVGFDHSVILQIMPYEEKNVNGCRVPEWVGHWTDCKVFHDTPEIEQYFDVNNNLVFDEEYDYLEILDSEEILEQEDIDSNEIVVEGASIHNLKNITVRIPKEKITVITGVSGSGKSSLAFDTIYHESQKQFMDLIATNSFMETDLKDSMVKKITGLQPSIAIEQRSLGMNPRSTVASVTRIGEYLRLLFATIGERVCPNCNEIIPENNVCSGCGTIFFTLTPAVFSYNHPEYMCPVCKGLGEELQVSIDLIVTNPELSILDGASPFWGNLRKHRENPNANWMKGEVLALAEDMQEDLEVSFKNLSEAFKQQVFYGSNGRPVTLRYENTNGRNGTISRPVEGVVNILQRLLVENNASKSLEHIERYVTNKKCSRCKGERLLEEGRLARIGNTRYPEATTMDIVMLKRWCHFMYGCLEEMKQEKCRDIFKKMIARLTNLEKVGLGYINLACK